MRGKKPVSVESPPVFGLPPAIQKMSLKQASACAGRIRVGRLGVVDEQHAALAADLLHAMRQAGERAQAFLDLLDRKAERERGAARAGRVLRIVHAAQRSDAAEQRDLGAAAARGLHDPPRFDSDAVGERTAHRHAHDALARLLDAVGGGLAPVVVDADNRRAVLLHAGDQPLLHRGVVRERAVAVEMILADVDQDADRRIERRREVDLIGRHLDHMHAAAAGRLQRQDRGADIAAELGLVAGGCRRDARSARWWSTCRWCR